MGVALVNARLPISQVVRIEREAAPGAALILCEHASNHFPGAFGTLGTDDSTRKSHAAWDPGALGLSRALSRRLDCTLAHAGVSRLIYDLNRPPQANSAMPLRSEIHDIPGNAALDGDERLRRTRAIYLPFHRRLRDIIACRLAEGRIAALLTIHSFSPVWHGQRRAVEIGVIHDADDRLARAVHARIAAASCMDVRLNEPYSAADGVTHTLALHATPMGLPHAMIEIRNDLIADAAAQDAMADRLAPCLAAAIEEITCLVG